MRIYYNTVRQYNIVRHAFTLALNIWRMPLGHEVGIYDKKIREYEARIKKKIANKISIASIVIFNFHYFHSFFLSFSILGSLISTYVIKLSKLKHLALLPTCCGRQSYPWEGLRTGAPRLPSSCQASRSGPTRTGRRQPASIVYQDQQGQVEVNLQQLQIRTWVVKSKGATGKGAPPPAFHSKA